MKSMNIRKLVSIVVMAMVLFAFTAPAMAECGDYAGNAYFCGEATFVLDNSATVIGVKSAFESVERLMQYQSTSRRSPSGIVDNGIIRHKALAKVRMEENEILCGGTSLQISIAIRADYVDLVKRVVAQNEHLEIEDVELTAKNIINATIYKEKICDVNSMAGHIFFLTKSDRVAIGTVTFCNGQTAVLYYGTFDCCRRLGFAAGWRNTQKPSPEPEPQQHCDVNVDIDITIIDIDINQYNYQYQWQCQQQNQCQWLPQYPGQVQAQYQVQHQEQYQVQHQEQYQMQHQEQYQVQHQEQYQMQHQEQYQVQYQPVVNWYGHPCNNPCY